MINEKYMAEALELARQAGLAGEIPVGCVIVRDEIIIGRGRNRREGDGSALGHAELEAIAQANAHVGGWRLDGCSLYVTLEPCPMCAGAIINARVKRVVYGAPDPKAGACGGVLNLFDYPFNHTPLLMGGVLETESGELLRRFFEDLRKSRESR